MDLHWQPHVLGCTVDSAAPQHPSFSTGAQHVLALTGPQHDSALSRVSAIDFGTSGTAAAAFLSFSAECLLDDDVTCDSFRCGKTKKERKRRSENELFSPASWTAAATAAKVTRFPA